MAIKKEMILDKGVVINHFRVIKVEQTYLKEFPILKISLLGYVNKACRDAEKVFLSELKEDQKSQPQTKEFWFTEKIVELPTVEGEDLSRAKVYVRIKNEVAEFVGSVDEI